MASASGSRLADGPLHRHHRPGGKHDQKGDDQYRDGKSRQDSPTGEIPEIVKHPSPRRLFICPYARTKHNGRGPVTDHKRRLSKQISTIAYPMMIQRAMATKKGRGVPQGEKAALPRQRTSVVLPTDLYERARWAVIHLEQAPESIGRLIENALERELARLEKTTGRPIQRRNRSLPRGPRPGSTGR